MKQVLVAFDGINFSNGAMQMVTRLHQHSPIHLTGAFIPRVDYDNLWNFKGDTGGMNFIPYTGIENKDSIEKLVDRFTLLCKQNNIRHTVKKDFFGFAIPELKRETRFADMLVLGAESFFTTGDEELSDYFKEALQHSECPTLVVPEKFNFPRSIILAYDGSASSVFAIKQFAYLFPELCSYPTLLVYSENEKEAMPDKEDISLLTSLHFPNLKKITLNVDPETEFAEWLNDRRRSLLVTGAFGRSLFSQLFKKSFVSEILEQHHIPVFIAHK